jgi:hypothetical protein
MKRVDMFEGKKIQHYVWQYYLRPWVTEGQLYCRSGGRIDRRSPKRVSAERYFYQTVELTPEEIAFIEEFLISISPPELKLIHHEWLKTFTLPYKLLDQLKAKGIKEENLNVFKGFIDKNLYEEIHTKMESDSIKYLDSLVKSDSRFYKDADARAEFLHFVNAQYFRTKRIKTGVRESAGEKLNERVGLNFERIWNPLSVLMVMNVTRNIYAEDFKLVLFENRTLMPFVTGDQPVVNTFATEVPKGDQVKGLELYFPISPGIAILITPEFNSEVQHSGA